jgi:hypothetical protein
MSRYAVLPLILLLFAPSAQATNDATRPAAESSQRDAQTREAGAGGNGVELKCNERRPSCRKRKALEERRDRN